jgi:hypothetical protein
MGEVSPIIRIAKTLNSNFNGRPVKDFRPRRGVGSTDSFHFKAAKWSPDGSCFLSNSNDDILRLFDL